MAKYEKKSTSKELSETVRTMPNNLKMEQSVLGCLIGGGDDIKVNIITRLKVEDFYVEANQIIYQVMLDLYNENKPIDYMSLFDALMVSQKIDDIGGLDYLTYLRTCVPSYTNYKYYVDIVKRDSVLRQVVKMGQDIMEHAYRSEDKDECLAYAEKLVFDLAQSEEKSDFVHIKEASDNVYKKIIEITKNKGAIKGLMTGFYGLDKLTNGFQKSDLVLLAARPSVGKTSFAMNVVDNAAKMGSKVAVFSLEMSADQLAQRMLFSDSVINMSKVLQGDISVDEAMRFMQATNEMKNKSIFVYDNSNVTAADVRAKCQQLAKKIGGLDLIMIDYLQLMSSPKSSKSDSNRQQEISEITRNLKITCRELEVPILLLSQLSRAVETRQGHKPQLSDLRESGAIEQDADIVMFLHNPNRYEDLKKEKMKQESSENRPQQSNQMDTVELIVAKHRNGALKTINLKFRAENTTFLDSDADRNAKSQEENIPSQFLENTKQKYKATPEEEMEFTNIDEYGE